MHLLRWPSSECLADVAIGLPGIVDDKNGNIANGEWTLG
jgi:hypothetical protein